MTHRLPVLRTSPSDRRAALNVVLMVNGNCHGNRYARPFDILTILDR